MNDMSISPTDSRTVRCSCSHCSNHGARPHVGSAAGVWPCAREPVGALPARHLAKVAALLDESLVHG